MSMYGMNVEQVRSLGQTLQAKAEEIRAIIGEINGAVGGTQWEGPDAQAFKGSQWPEHQAQLNAVAEALTGFGQSALNNASEQEQVSSR